MNKKQAEEKGYRFTGIYGRYKADVKFERETKFTKLGYKAVVVTVPDSKYSRGGGGEGYSVYAEQKYFDDKQIDDLTKAIEHIPTRIKEAKKMFDETINSIEADDKQWSEELRMLKQKRG